MVSGAGASAGSISSSTLVDLDLNTMNNFVRMRECVVRWI
jgi:hypothetical protein